MVWPLHLIKLFHSTPHSIMPLHHLLLHLWLFIITTITQTVITLLNHCIDGLLSDISFAVKVMCSLNNKIIKLKIITKHKKQYYSIQISFKIITIITQLSSLILQIIIHIMLVKGVIKNIFYFHIINIQIVLIMLNNYWIIICIPPLFPCHNNVWITLFSQNSQFDA